MMSNLSMRARKVIVVGGGLIGLSTAINIQENVPNVHVELVHDFGFTPTMTALMGTSNAVQEAVAATSNSPAGSRNTSTEFLCKSGYTVDGEEQQSLVVDAVRDSLDVGAASLLTREELSSMTSTRAWSPDDVIWLPQSVPGLDDDTTGKGGHYRFWAVLTWYHLNELVEKESSHKTGVSLLPDYVLHQWKDKQVSDWWKDLVPDYRQVQNESQDKSASGSRYSSSFTTPVINVPRYVQYLTERLLRCGGRLTRGNISSIKQLSGPCDLLVNCSGLKLNEQSYKEFPSVQAQNIEQTPSIQQSDCSQCCQFEGDRLEACLEADTITHRGRPLSVVHNYGFDQDHLATLHWGCAQEAARLASDILAGRFIGWTSKL